MSQSITPTPVLLSADPDVSGSRILVIHDHPEMRAYVERVLSEDYVVLNAPDGQVALTVAQSDAPDLILAHVQLPDLDGFGLLRELRSDPRTAEIPVILLAVPVDDEVRVESIGAGAEEYMVRPFSEEELLARVSAQLQMARVRRETAEALRASEIRYRRLFEAAHDGILILDARTRKITDVNPFMIQMLDYPREHFIGKELWEIGIFNDKEESLRAMQALEVEGSVRYENRPLQMRNGGSHAVEVVANVYREDQQLVIQCNIRDTSERERFEVERELLWANEKSARLDAEAANRAKDLFLAMLSHELRTPLNAIVGWTAILREGGTRAELEEGLDVIDRSTKAQLQLVEDMLDVSRIVSGKLRLDVKPCELTEVIMAAQDNVLPAATAREIKLTLDLDATAAIGMCDGARIQQVIWNLLVNAIKFTPKGGSVKVRLWRELTVVKIEVSDTGVGMDPDFVPYVFDRFRQGDAGTQRRYGGLGLGLSIVKHIVEMHGGTVSAQSAGEGLGSTFTVTLPVSSVIVDEIDIEPIPMSHDGLQGMSSLRLDGLRVLVVDDEPDARRLLLKILQRTGAVITVASSAAEAMEQLKSTPQDILLSDIAMPDEDGYSLIAQIRGEGYSAKELPAIALTAFAADEYQERALLAGFQVRVCKPVDPKHLIVVIASLAGLTGHVPDTDCHGSRIRQSRKEESA